MHNTKADNFAIRRDVGNLTTSNLRKVMNHSPQRSFRTHAYAELLRRRRAREKPIRDYKIVYQ